MPLTLLGPLRSSDGSTEESWTHSGKGRMFKSPQKWQENFLLQGQLSVPTHFSIHSTPVLPQQHVKDPSHPAKSAGGRLLLHMHPMNVTLNEVTP